MISKFSRQHGLKTVSELTSNLLHFSQNVVAILEVVITNTTARGGGGTPYMGYIGMCGPKEYGFSAVLVINRVSIFAPIRFF